MTPALILLELLAFAEATLEREPGSRFAAPLRALQSALRQRYPNLDLSSSRLADPAARAQDATTLDAAGGLSPALVPAWTAFLEALPPPLLGDRLAAMRETMLAAVRITYQSRKSHAQAAPRQRLAGHLLGIAGATRNIPAEPARFTDLTLYEGAVFRPEDLPDARKLPDPEALRPGRPYTLEIAVRRNRTGIGAGDPAAVPVLNPRRVTETLTLYARVTTLYGPVTADQPIVRLDWPFDADSAPAYVRLSIGHLDGRVASAGLEIRLYHANLDLLDVLRLELAIAATADAPAQNGARIDWPRTSGAQPRLDPDAALRAITISVRPTRAGFAFELLVRRDGEPVALPFTRRILPADLEDLLARVRDLWTDLAIGLYAERLTVTATNWNTALTRLRDVGMLAWDLLFGSFGAAQQVGNLLADLDPADGTHVQITYIDDADFVFPWNLLYPPQDPAEPVNALRFWGARYQLEQVREGSKWNDLEAEPVRLALALDPNFGQSVAETKMFDDLLAQAGARLQLLGRSTSQDELKASLLGTPPAHLYYFFCQGYAPAGPTVLRRDGARLLQERIESAPPEARKAFETLLPLIARMGDQPWMFFGGAEITETWLRLLRGFFLKRSPVIFLNMCHSAGLLPTMTSGFVRLFLDRNAAAVIGTESVMTAVFAHAFAERFFAHLLGGDDLGTALLHARREFLASDKRNPLGLAYTLYGRATIRIGASIVPGAHSPEVAVAPTA